MKIITLDEYFMNPDNVANEVILNAYDFTKKYTPDEFYSIGETEQERSHILMKRIECEDGFSMSVQANQGAYCNPRTTHRSRYVNIYNEYEIGFPSEKEDLIMGYKDGKDSEPTNTVYGYVPKEIIEKVIEKHGGIKLPITPKGNQ